MSLCELGSSKENGTAITRKNYDGKDVLFHTPRGVPQKETSLPLKPKILFGGLRSHHASRASFCLLLDRGGEKKALPESRQAFDVAAARTSRLVNLVFSRQTSFFECEHPFTDKPMVISEPLYQKHGY